jgi:hypothetical protein
MAQKHLATYLNDHLAGSVTLLEMLAHLASAYAGSDVERFARELRNEVIADREELEGLMTKWGVGQSPPRKASAWLAEKFAEVKLRMDDPAGGALHLLEAIEAVSLGVEGKRSLWRSLAAAAEEDGNLKADYERLLRRAEDQRDRIEGVRLESAKAALAK